MFQNIVNATEPMADEKEATAFVSNNPIRKEIVMYVADSGRNTAVEIKKKKCFWFSREKLVKQQDLEIH